MKGAYKLKLDERRKPHVTVNADICQGCKTCLKVCMFGVYRWNREKNCSEAAYTDNCTACRHCEFYCPAKCIEVTPPEVVFYDAVYDPLGLNDKKEG